MAIDILNSKVNEANGLLSKIQIGGKIYEVKDLLARQNIGTLSTNIEQVAADLAALKYVAGTGVFADDAAIKSYVDSQVGSINKFDVRVLTADEALPTASAETMFILFLKPDANAEADAYIEYITVKNGETYTWEAIGSTKMDVSGLVTEEELATELANYSKTEELGDLAFKDESELDLKDLAHKDSASGTVAGQTISGVKATGTSTGSINVALTSGTEAITSTGNYTPAGTVSGGKVTATGTVAITVTNADAQATLATADYQPAGSVSVTAATTDVQVVKSAGTAASFTEGTFTPASLTHEAVEKSYATAGLIGEVNEDECLVFTNAAVEAMSASKITAFSGGSKDADSFTANVPAEVETKTVATGIASSSFEGTVAAGLKVTGVTYQKHDGATATFTGNEVDVTGASFSGSAATIEVSGNGKTYAIDAENTKFNGAAIELNVGDIAVESKEVTVR